MDYLPQSFLICLWVNGCLTLVVKQAVNLCGECRDNIGVEKGIESGKQECTDDYGDQNLDSGINIAFRLLGDNSGLNGNSRALASVLDFLNELFHEFTSIFL